MRPAPAPRPGLAALLLILGAALAVPAALPAQTTTVVVVRHAEKATAERDTELSEAGWARARALAAALEHAGVDAVIATERRRTQQTAQPLAERLGLTPEVVGFDGGAEASARSVADRIRAQHAGRTVLVVGHSNTVPLIVAALGGPALPELCESEYEQLFVLTVRDDGRAALLRSRYGAPDAQPASGCPG
jgi:broad specificity phosphatase PhoE